MQKYSLSNFSGMFPRFQSYLIADKAAQTIVDSNIISGGLESFRQDSFLRTTEKLYKDLYRYSYNGTTRWLYFDEKVDIVRSAVIDDLSNQTYIANSLGLRVFDKDTLFASDKSFIDETNSYKAGISRPTKATLSVKTGTTGSAETRAYCLAYGRKWPSGKIDLGPASVAAETSAGVAHIDVKVTEQVVLSNIKANSHTDEFSQQIYIYRSTVGTEGEATWREVINFSSAVGALLPTSVTYDNVTETYTFTDNVNNVDLGAIPQNFEWECPDGLQGIITLRNGVFAAYKNNTIYLSVPYQGHAWPAAYAIPLDFDLVGLGCFGNTLVICTTNKTFLCQASNPESPILVPLQESNTCVAKHSIVSLQESVIYATRYGLVQVTNNGVTPITNKIISEAFWRQLNPSTIQACSFNSKYLMFFETDRVPYSGCIVDLNDLTIGILGLSQKVSCLRMDDISSDIFIQYIHPILLRPAIFTFASNYSLKRVYRWTSKKFLNTYGLVTLSAGKVNFYKDTTIIDNPEFSYIAASGAFNAPYVNLFALNGDATTNQHVQITHASDWCMLTFYMNDTQKAVIHVRDNIPFRLPSGFRGDSFYVDIVSTQPIARVQLASGIGELE